MVTVGNTDAFRRRRSWEERFTLRPPIDGQRPLSTEIIPVDDVCTQMGGNRLFRVGKRIAEKESEALDHGNSLTSRPRDRTMEFGLLHQALLLDGATNKGRPEARPHGPRLWRREVLELESARRRGYIDGADEGSRHRLPEPRERL